MSEVFVFQPEDLSNEDYHGEQYAEYISGSDLALVHSKSPAHWKYGERKETPALAFGTAMHCAILEPEKFKSEFCRELDKSNYPDALSSDAAMKSWLKAHGRGGYSNKKTPELIEMIRETGEEVEIWSEIVEQHEVATHGMTKLKPADFDKVITMREVIELNPEYQGAINTGHAEISLIGEIDVDGQVYKVKCRPDLITDDYGIWDLKSCVSCHPEEFARAAVRLGYWLKMALQHDLFKAAFGVEPSQVVLLAQEKEAPYVAQAYRMTQAQLEYGREQYQQTLKYLQQCIDTGIFPAYGNGVIDLDTPAWMKID